jgi:hypothetical protein
MYLPVLYYHTSVMYPHLYAPPRPFLHISLLSPLLLLLAFFFLLVYYSFLTLLTRELSGPRFPVENSELALP